MTLDWVYNRGEDHCKGEEAQSFIRSATAPDTTDMAVGTQYNPAEEVGVNRVRWAIIAHHRHAVFTTDTRQQEAAADERVSGPVHEVVAQKQVHNACNGVQSDVLR